MILRLRLGLVVLLIPSTAACVGKLDIASGGIEADGGARAVAEAGVTTTDIPDDAAIPDDATAVTTMPVQDPTGSSPSDAAPPAAFSATAVAAARAACAQPEGDLDPYNDWPAMEARAEGSWYFCKQTGVEMFAFESLQLDPYNGNWYRLVDDGHGGLVQKTGGPMECNYLTPSDAGDLCYYFNLYAGDRLHSVEIAWTTYDTGPRAMHLGYASTESDAYFVALRP